MKWQRTLFVTSALVGLTLLQTGCVARRTVVVHEPARPVYVVQGQPPPPATIPAPGQPAPGAPGQAPTIEVQQAPPAPIVETMPPSPGGAYVWTPGYWVWSGQWVWYPGRWLVPPHPRSVWITGRWELHRGRVWHYYPGHWQ